MTYHLCWVLLTETVISPAYTQGEGVNLHKDVNTKVGITGSLREDAIIISGWKPLDERLEYSLEGLMLKLKL